MTTVGARRTANAVVAFDGGLILASVALTLGRRLTGQDRLDWFFLAVTALGAAIYLWVGRAIVIRQPTNTIGWLLLGIPTLALLAFTNGAYATHAIIVDPGGLPLARASAWVDRWILVPTLSSFIPLFLLYPDGHLPSRRWRWVGVLAFAAPVFTAAAFAVTPGLLTGAMSDIEPARITNPLGIDAASGVIDVLTQLGGFLILASAVAALVGVIVRYRRADGEVRQQIRWLAFVGVAFFVELGISVVGQAVFGENDAIGLALFILMFMTLVIGIPVACGVAILKYRLYDLDVVVRKSFVFAALAVFIAVVYALIVGGVGTLIGASENSPALSFVAAVVLAIAFQPARTWAHRLADRLVFGRRATPYEVLADFSSRVGEAYAAEDVLQRMAQVLASGTGADSATVWLRVGDGVRTAAIWPPEAVPAATPPPDAVSVLHQEETLGALSVTMPANNPMTPATAKLVADLASQAGLVLRNVRLIEELRASRQRLVAAQDEERRRIERNIHDGAQQQLVALSVKLRLAEQLVSRDAERATAMIATLQAEMAEALQNLRDLARGIYPPLLADQGLGPALVAQARKTTVPTTVRAEGVGRYPQDVEATVYFTVLESLQNVAKYAGASQAQIEVAARNGDLTFEVRDDGRGFDPGSTGYGTGLRGIADRLDAIGGSLSVRSAPGEGTTVAGRIPVARFDVREAVKSDGRNHFRDGAMRHLWAG